MYDVHRFIIHTGHFGQHLFVVGHHFFKVQFVGRQHRNALNHHCAGIFTSAAVYCKQQSLGQIRTRSEELDLTAYGLIAHTACYTVVITIAHLAHQVIVFILYGAGVHTYLRTKILEPFWQIGTPEHCHVRLGARAEIVEGLQEPERCLGHFHTAIIETSSKRFRHPCGISGKYIIVRRHAQMTHHTEFDHKLVYQFLGESLVNFTVSQIIFDKNIKK